MMMIQIKMGSGIGRINILVHFGALWSVVQIFGDFSGHSKVISSLMISIQLVYNMTQTSEMGENPFNCLFTVTELNVL